MTTLAKAFTPADLDERAHSLYEDFRPEVPAGTKGLGAAGILDLERIVDLGK